MTRTASILRRRRTSPTYTDRSNFCFRSALLRVLCLTRRARSGCSLLSNPPSAEQSKTQRSRADKMSSEASYDPEDYASEADSDGWGPNSTSGTSEDSDDDYTPNGKKRSPRKQKGSPVKKKPAVVKIPLSAKVTTLATQAHENPERDSAIERRLYLPDRTDEQMLTD